MNWGQLKTDLASTIHRTDIDWQALQEFANADISRDLDVIDNEDMVALTITQSVGMPLWEAPLPADFGRVKALIGGGRGTPWSSVDLQALMMLADRQGCFAISGEKLWLGSSGPAVLLYAQRMKAMTADEDTNVILTNYPNVYLHCLAMYGFERAQDTEMRGLQQEAYRDAIIQANANKSYQTRTAGSSPRIVGGMG
jgi:hypothetical protein